MTAPGKQQGGGDVPGFSFAKLALFSLGSGVAVLLVAIPIIMVLTKVSSVAALIVGLLALVLMVAVIGLVSHRMISAVERQVRGDSGDDT
ncbi:hypothetical protein GII30_13955 [Gordonia amarae]|uniref:Uncharacterized protein n=2 Tax=Gordonia amarae TaxID=36821 RepID=G7GRZ4_9ACTN|nr:hypothetical protein [Gordonia amarae]MCS3879502.1 putative neutral ceramidase superfamily lipid hydrolase [Gordonia amarae]QHN17976.1 hypothetical protein GII35_14270 [Gordonia amarae]QHN22496.1 hypothetical protein GII34_14010 [Gordonia amarae]QHN31361.1 hypothetical protein GII32_14120 [Gordonia amarae]QHN40107.1 hypothetical protein GII30_13955 [Gordonia amarae]